MLIGAAAKLSEAGQAARYNETAVFYFAEILTRLVYEENTRIRTEPRLREATLKFLDALVGAGSSPAFELGDDFLTPLPQ